MVEMKRIEIQPANKHIYNNNKKKLFESTTTTTKINKKLERIKSIIKKKKLL